MDLRDAENLALELMGEHGLIADGWAFRFDRAVRRAGLTHYVKRTIFLSREITRVGSPEAVRDTILHEIAHAFTRGDHHGARWRRQFLALGGSGHTRRRLSTEENAALARETKYKSSCELCGATFLAARKSKNMGVSYCVVTERCRLTNSDPNKRHYLVWSDREGKIVRGDVAVLMGIGA